MANRRTRPPEAAHLTGKERLEILIIIVAQIRAQSSNQIMRPARITFVSSFYARDFAGQAVPWIIAHGARGLFGFERIFVDS